MDLIKKHYMCDMNSVREVFIPPKFLTMAHGQHVTLHSMHLVMRLQ